jgi:L,D-transpeptidase catalytic domain
MPLFPWLHALIFGVLLCSTQSVTTDESPEMFPLTPSQERCYEAFPHSYDSEVKKILNANPELNPRMVKMGVLAYHWALTKSTNSIDNPAVLTLVDYTLPSTKKRLSVIDLQSGLRLFHLRAGHALRSGILYATHFSNILESNQSSLGCFVTALGPYQGALGESLALHGEEEGLNDNVMQRHVVIHPAVSMNPSYILSHKRAGRSLGCIALAPKDAHQLIQTIKGGSVLFVYADEELCDPTFHLLS